VIVANKKDAAVHSDEQQIVCLIHKWSFSSLCCIDKAKKGEKRSIKELHIKLEDTSGNFGRCQGSCDRDDRGTWRMEGHRREQ
jgi:hypothetical protein